MKQQKRLTKRWLAFLLSLVLIVGSVMPASAAPLNSDAGDEPDVVAAETAAEGTDDGAPTDDTGDPEDYETDAVSEAIPEDSGSGDSDSGSGESNSLSRNAGGALYGNAIKLTITADDLKIMNLPDGLTGVSSPYSYTATGDDAVAVVAELNALVELKAAAKLGTTALYGFKWQYNSEGETWTDISDSNTGDWLKDDYFGAGAKTLKLSWTAPTVVITDPNGSAKTASGDTLSYTAKITPGTGETDIEELPAGYAWKWEPLNAAGTEASTYVDPATAQYTVTDGAVSYKTVATNNTGAGTGGSIKVKATLVEGTSESDYAAVADLTTASDSVAATLVTATVIKEYKTLTMTTAASTYGVTFTNASQLSDLSAEAAKLPVVAGETFNTDGTENTVTYYIKDASATDDAKIAAAKLILGDVEHLFGYDSTDFSARVIKLSENVVSSTAALTADQATAILSGSGSLVISATSKKTERALAENDRIEVTVEGDDFKMVNWDAALTAAGGAAIAANVDYTLAASTPAVAGKANIAYLNSAGKVVAGASGANKAIIIYKATNAGFDAQITAITAILKGKYGLYTPDKITLPGKSTAVTSGLLNINYTPVNGNAVGKYELAASMKHIASAAITTSFVTAAGDTNASGGAIAVKIEPRSELGTAISTASAAASLGVKWEILKGSATASENGAAEFGATGETSGVSSYSDGIASNKVYLKATKPGKIKLKATLVDKDGNNLPGDEITNTTDAFSIGDYDFITINVANTQIGVEYNAIALGALSGAGKDPLVNGGSSNYTRGSANTIKYYIKDTYPAAIYTDEAEQKTKATAMVKAIESDLTKMFTAKKFYADPVLLVSNPTITDLAKVDWTNATQVTTAISILDTPNTEIAVSAATENETIRPTLSGSSAEPLKSTADIAVFTPVKESDEYARFQFESLSTKDDTTVVSGAGWEPGTDYGWVWNYAAIDKSELPGKYNGTGTITVDDQDDIALVYVDSDMVADTEAIYSGTRDAKITAMKPHMSGADDAAKTTAAQNKMKEIEATAGGLYIKPLTAGLIRIKGVQHPIGTNGLLDEATFGTVDFIVAINEDLDNRLTFKVEQVGASSSAVETKNAALEPSGSALKAVELTSYGANGTESPTLSKEESAKNTANEMKLKITVMSNSSASASATNLAALTTFTFTGGTNVKVSYLKEDNGGIDINGEDGGSEEDMLKQASLDFKIPAGKNSAIVRVTAAEGLKKSGEFTYLNVTPKNAADKKKYADPTWFRVKTNQKYAVVLGIDSTSKNAPFSGTIDADKAIIWRDAGEDLYSDTVGYLLDAYKANFKGATGYEAKSFKTAAYTTTSGSVAYEKGITASDGKAFAANGSTEVFYAGDAVTSVGTGDDRAKLTHNIGLNAVYGRSTALKITKVESAIGASTVKTDIYEAGTTAESDATKLTALTLTRVGAAGTGKKDGVDNTNNKLTLTVSHAGLSEGDTVSIMKVTWPSNRATAALTSEDKLTVEKNQTLTSTTFTITPGEGFVSGTRLAVVVAPKTADGTANAEFDFVLNVNQYYTVTAKAATSSADHAVGDATTYTVLKGTELSEFFATNNLLDEDTVEALYKVDKGYGFSVEDALDTLWQLPTGAWTSPALASAALYNSSTHGNKTIIGDFELTPKFTMTGNVDVTFILDPAVYNKNIGGGARLGFEVTDPETGVTSLSNTLVNTLTLTGDATVPASVAPTYELVGLPAAWKPAYFKVASATEVPAENASPVVLDDAAQKISADAFYYVKLYTSVELTNATKASGAIASSVTSDKTEAVKTSAYNHGGRVYVDAYYGTALSALPTQTITAGKGTWAGWYYEVGGVWTPYVQKSSSETGTIVDSSIVDPAIGLALKGQAYNTITLKPIAGNTDGLIAADKDSALSSADTESTDVWLKKANDNKIQVLSTYDAGGDIEIAYTSDIHRALLDLVKPTIVKATKATSEAEAKDTTYKAEFRSVSGKAASATDIYDEASNKTLSGDTDIYVAYVGLDDKDSYTLEDTVDTHQFVWKKGAIPETTAIPVTLEVLNGNARVTTSEKVRFEVVDIDKVQMSDTIGGSYGNGVTISNDKGAFTAYVMPTNISAGFEGTAKVNAYIVGSNAAPISVEISMKRQYKVTLTIDNSGSYDGKMNHESMLYLGADKLTREGDDEACMYFDEGFDLYALMTRITNSSTQGILWTADDPENDEINTILTNSGGGSIAFKTTGSGSSAEKEYVIIEDDVSLKDFIPTADDATGVRAGKYAGTKLASDLTVTGTFGPKKITVSYAWAPDSGLTDATVLDGAVSSSNTTGHIVLLETVKTAKATDFLYPTAVEMNATKTSTWEPLFYIKNPVEQPEAPAATDPQKAKKTAIRNYWTEYLMLNTTADVVGTDDGFNREAILAPTDSNTSDFANEIQTEVGKLFNTVGSNVTIYVTFATPVSLKAAVDRKGNPLTLANIASKALNADDQFYVPYGENFKEFFEAAGYAPTADDVLFAGWWTIGTEEELGDEVKTWTEYDPNGTELITESGLEIYQRWKVQVKVNASSQEAHSNNESDHGSFKTSVLTAYADQVEAQIADTGTYVSVTKKEKVKDLTLNKPGETTPVYDIFLGETYAQLAEIDGTALLDLPNKAGGTWSFVEGTWANKQNYTVSKDNEGAISLAAADGYKKTDIIGVTGAASLAATGIWQAFYQGEIRYAVSVAAGDRGRFNDAGTKAEGKILDDSKNPQQGTQLSSLVNAATDMIQVDEDARILGFTVDNYANVKYSSGAAVTAGTLLNTTSTTIRLEGPVVLTPQYADRYINLGINPGKGYFKTNSYVASAPVKEYGYTASSDDTTGKYKGTVLAKMDGTTLTLAQIQAQLDKFKAQNTMLVYPEAKGGIDAYSLYGFEYTSVASGTTQWIKYDSTLTDAWDAFDIEDVAGYTFTAVYYLPAITLQIENGKGYFTASTQPDFDDQALTYSETPKEEGKTDETGKYYGAFRLAAAPTLNGDLVVDKDTGDVRHTYYGPEKFTAVFTLVDDSGNEILTEAGSEPTDPRVSIVAGDELNVTSITKWTYTKKGSGAGTKLNAFLAANGGKKILTVSTLDGDDTHGFVITPDFTAGPKTVSFELGGLATEATGSAVTTYGQEHYTEIAKAVLAQKVPAGRYVTKPNIPDTIGAWTLKGWYPVDSADPTKLATKAWNFSSDTVTTSVTLRAVWTTNVTVTLQDPAKATGAKVASSDSTKGIVKKDDLTTVLTGLEYSDTATVTAAQIQGLYDNTALKTGGSPAVALYRFDGLYYGDTSSKYDGSAIKLNTTAIKDEELQLTARYYTLAKLVIPASGGTAEAPTYDAKFNSKTQDLLSDGTETGTEYTKNIRLIVGDPATLQAQLNTYDASKLIVAAGYNFLGWAKDATGTEFGSKDYVAEAGTQIYPRILSNDKTLTVNIAINNSTYGEALKSSFVMEYDAAKTTTYDVYQQVAKYVQVKGANKEYGLDSVTTASGAALATSASGAALASTVAVKNASTQKSTLSVTANFAVTKMPVKFALGDGAWTKDVVKETDAPYDTVTAQNAGTITVYAKLNADKTGVDLTPEDMNELVAASALYDEVSRGLFLDDTKWYVSTATIAAAKTYASATTYERTDTLKLTRVNDTIWPVYVGATVEVSIYKNGVKIASNNNAGKLDKANTKLSYVNKTKADTAGAVSLMQGESLTMTADVQPEIAKQYVNVGFDALAETSLSKDKKTMTVDSNATEGNNNVTIVATYAKSAGYDATSGSNYYTGKAIVADPKTTDQYNSIITSAAFFKFEKSTEGNLTTQLGRLGITNGILVVLNDYYGKSTVENGNSKAITNLSQLKFKPAWGTDNAGNTKRFSDDGISGIAQAGTTGSFAWAEKAGAGSNAAKSITLSKYKNSVTTVDVDVVYTDSHGSITKTLPVMFVTVDYKLTNKTVTNAKVGEKDYISYGRDTDGNFVDKTDLTYEITPVITAPEEAKAHAQYASCVTDVYGVNKVITGDNNADWVITQTPQLAKVNVLSAAVGGGNITIGKTAGMESMIKNRMAITLTASYNGGQFKTSTKVYATTNAAPLHLGAAEGNINAAAKSVMVNYNGELTDVSTNVVEDTGLNETIVGYDNPVYTYTDLVGNLDRIRITGTIFGGRYMKDAKGAYKEPVLTIKSDNAKTASVVNIANAQGKNAKYRIDTIDGNDEDLNFTFELTAKQAGQAIVTVVNSDDNKSEFQIVINALSQDLAVRQTLLAGGTSDTLTKVNLVQGYNAANDGTVTLVVTPTSSDAKTNFNYSLTADTKAEIKSGKAISTPVVTTNANHGVDLTFKILGSGSDTITIHPVGSFLVNGTGKVNGLKDIKINVNVTANLKAPTVKITKKANVAYKLVQNTIQITPSEDIESIEIVGATNGYKAAMTHTNYHWLNADGSDTGSHVKTYDYPTKGAVNTLYLGYMGDDLRENAPNATLKDFANTITAVVKYKGFSTTSTITIRPSYETVAPTVALSTKSLTLLPKSQVNSGYVKATLTTATAKGYTMPKTTGDELMINPASEVKNLQKAKDILVLTEGAVSGPSLGVTNSNSGASTVINGKAICVGINTEESAKLVATKAVSFSNALLYSDDIYRGIVIPVAVGYNATGKVVPSFDKAVKSATLNRTIEDYRDSATIELPLTGGATADILTPYSDDEKLHVEGSDAKSKAVLGSGLVIEGDIKDTGDWSNNAVLYVNFGTNPAADGTYNFVITGKVGSQLLTAKAKVVVQSKTTKDNSLTLKRTGSLDVYERENTGIIITPTYESMGNDWLIETANFVDPSLEGATFLGPDEVGNTVTLQLNPAATDIRTKKAYEPYLKLTLKNRRSGEYLTITPDVKKSKGGQNALKGVKVTQVASNFQTFINGSTKSVTVATVDGTANEAGNNVADISVGIVRGGVTVNNKGINGLSYFTTDAKAAPLNNRISAVVADPDRFSVMFMDSDGTSNCTTGRIIVTQNKMLTKGKYKVRLYLYPEGCANDTAAKQIDISVTVK